MQSEAGSKFHEETQSRIQLDQAVIAPIHNYASYCPEDVLRLIFEVTVSASRYPDTNLRQASRIASVCRAWRIVALSTPKIWNNIRLHIRPNDDGLEDYWARTMERVKKAPLTIKISNIRFRWPQKLFTMIREASVPVELLHLEVAHPRESIGQRQILGEMPLEVENLSLSIDESDYDDKGPWVSKNIDCGQFLKFVCCRRRLSITGGDRFYFVTSITATARCSRLSLSWVTGLKVDDVFLNFPLLESLHLSHCPQSYCLDIKTVPRLRCLQIERTNAAPWLVRIRFPELARLSYSGFQSPELNQFLHLHRTITTLTLGDGAILNNSFKEMAECASQVVSLTLSASWAHHLIGEHIFPSLRSLVIVDCASMPPSQFESLVKSRCLPPSHPQSVAMSPSLIFDELFIDVGERHLSASQLGQSVLYTEATKQVEREYDIYRVRIKLSWPTR